MKPSARTPVQPGAGLIKSAGYDAETLGKSQRFSALTRIARLAAVIMFVTVILYTACATGPVTSHPRLWVTQADLPRLQSWAVTTNPLYLNAFVPALNSAISTYNTYWPGGVPTAAYTDPNTGRDTGISNWVYDCTEAYAEFFAFASLLQTNQTLKDDYANKARNMLMYVIHEAAKGQAAGLPFRDPLMPVYNRANYWGEAFGLTVDWIYPYLTAADKEQIRNVYLTWCSTCLHATTTSSGEEHPNPIGTTNSSVLLSNKLAIRYAANNYSLGHMRMITLMSLCLDAGDDIPTTAGEAAAGALRAYIGNATGAWLYLEYAAYENAATVASAYGVPQTGLGFAAGGLSPEGFLYGHSMAYLFEALLALHTAGYGTPALSGPQINLLTSTFWDKFVDGTLHSIAPVSYTDPSLSYLGPITQMANYGDVLHFWITPDYFGSFGALGVYDILTNNSSRLAKERWIALNAIEGGAGKLYSRAGTNIWGNSYATDAILYFMLFDPNAATPPDPRPNLPLDFFSPSIGRVLSHSDWTTNASWFTYIDSWMSINHQNGCGNQFEFYRKGEWLTQELAGYTNDFIAATPDYHNTLGLKNYNSAPNFASTLQWYEGEVWNRGGQWFYGLDAGDPVTTASFGANYAAVTGDSTNLYNRPDVYTPSHSAIDILHASRSIVWLKPDHIVIYDRAQSAHAGLFKRFNLMYPTNPTVSGNLATMTTTNGQKLYCRTLMPQSANIVTTAIENLNLIAELEPMHYREIVQDLSNPTSIRFLHVLQGADAAVGPDAATTITQVSGTAYDGAVVHNTAVLFRVNLSGTFTGLSYTAASGTTKHYVTGLNPNTGYTVATSAGPGGTVQAAVTPGGATLSDSGGVLVFNSAVAGIDPMQWLTEY